MRFALSDEQKQIKDSARAFLSEEASAEARRRALSRPQGYDDGLWRAMSADLGWTAISIPEAYGGLGLGPIELALLLEEMGRTLAVAPFFETLALAAPMILACGDEAQRQALLAPIAAGQTSATLAFRNASRRCNLDEIGPVFDGAVLSAAAHYVPFAHVADLLVVLARTPAGDRQRRISVITLPASTPGILITRERSIDQTRPYATVTFQNVAISRSDILDDCENGAEVARRALAQAAALLAAEQTGGADFSLSAVVEYAKQRVQFDRPISSCQALKHRFADMAVQVEASRSAAYYAAAAMAEQSDEAMEAAAIARAVCSDAYLKCAADALQLHGGIGFTWEHHAHLYFKRARSSATLLGSPQEHRERLAQLIGLDRLISEPSP